MKSVEGYAKRLAAPGLASVALVLAGCAVNSNVFKPIRAPRGVTDLGVFVTEITGTGGDYEVRGFRSPPQLVSQVYCGEITGASVPKFSFPVSGGDYDVLCVVDSGFNNAGWNNGDTEHFNKLPVHYVEPTS